MYVIHIHNCMGLARGRAGRAHVRAVPRKVKRASVVVACFARTRGMFQRVCTCQKYFQIIVPSGFFLEVSNGLSGQCARASHIVSPAHIMLRSLHAMHEEYKALRFM